MEDKINLCMQGEIENNQCDNENIIIIKSIWKQLLQTVRAFTPRVVYNGIDNISDNEDLDSVLVQYTTIDFIPCPNNSINGQLVILENLFLENLSMIDTYKLGLSNKYICKKNLDTMAVYQEEYNSTIFVL